MPRAQVSPTRLAWRKGAWLLAFPLLFALGFGGIAAWALADARLLERYGIEGVAEVTAKYQRETRDSEGRRSVTRHVAFRFQPQSGGLVEGEQSVARSFHDMVLPGDEIWIRYVGHDPHRHEIEPGNNTFIAVLFGGISVLGWVGFGVGGLWLWRRLGAQMRAVRDGEVREARVTSRAVTSIRVNGRTMWRLHWRDAVGEVGRSGLLREAALDGWPVGSVVVIYVDPVTGTAFWEEDLAPGAGARRGPG